MVELDTHFPWYDLILCIHKYWLHGSLQKSIERYEVFSWLKNTHTSKYQPQLLYPSLLRRVLFLSLNIFHLPLIQLRLCLRRLRFPCKYFIGEYFNEFPAPPASSLRLVNPQIHARQGSQEVKVEGERQARLDLHPNRGH